MQYPAAMPDTTETARDEMIGRVVGSWRVIKLLGEGGMGSVYMGEHPAIGSKVAIKILHPRFDADERIVERFFNEAKAVNVIGHENIVSILDFNVADGRRHYFVMEFLHGRALQALVEAGTPLPLERVGPILLQCCRALQAAHERGIVHRDFKPDNVFLIDRSGRADFVKLVDFGIAKLTDSPNAHLTQTGTVMGTPAYMSPEQAAGESTIDARSDIYSLGVTMFQMMTGKQPFAEAGPSFGRILAAHLREPPPRPRAIAPEIPAELEEIILKTLEKNPDDRYQTMSELHDALLGCMEGLGISLELPPVGDRQGTTSAKAPAARRSNPAVTPARGATLPQTAHTVAHPAPRPRGIAPVVIVGAGAAVAVAIVVLALSGSRWSSTPQPRKAMPVPAPAAPVEAAEQKPPPSAQPLPPSAQQPPPSTKQQPSDIPPAAQRSSGQTRAAPERTVAKATKPDRESPPPAAVPRRIAVFFQCAGAQEVCSALRTALDDELQKARFASVRSAARADIGIAARIAAVQGRVTPDLQFAVRTYSIDVSGEAVQSSEAVPMPAPTTLSYDPSFGSERVAEKARLVAGEVAERLQAFVANQRR